MCSAPVACEPGVEHMASSHLAATRPSTGRVGPYAKNPFRIVGLGTGAPDVDVKRRGRQLQMELALANDDADAAADIRDALATLQDPVARFEAELTWVRLVPDPVPPDVDPLDRQVTESILTLLNQRTRGGDSEARHDMAVLLHASAVEAETATRTEHQRALEAWRQVLADVRFWDAISVRALALNDPRLNDARVASMRAELPLRILLASAASIRTTLQVGNDDISADLLAVLESSEFPSDAIGAARQQALGPLLSSARATVRDLRTRINEPRPADGRSAEIVLAAIWQAATDALVPALKRLRRLAPQTGEVSVLSDDGAALLDTLATRLFNETERIDLMLAVSEAAYEVAASELVRERLRVELRTVRTRACYAALERVRAALARRDADAAAEALDEARSHTDDDASRAAVDAAARAVDALRPRRRINTYPPPSDRPDSGSSTPTRPILPLHPNGVRTSVPWVGLPFLGVAILVAVGIILIVGSFSSQPSQTSRPAVTPTAQIAARPTEAPKPAQPAYQPPILPTAMSVPTFAPLPLPPPPAAALAPTLAPPAVPTPTLERVLATVRVSGAGSERLKLRRTPGLGGDVIDGLDDGEVLDIIDEPRVVDGMRWAHVRTKNQTRAYVAADFLVPADATATLAPTLARQTPPPTIAVQATVAPPATTVSNAAVGGPATGPAVQNPTSTASASGPAPVPTPPPPPRQTATSSARPGQSNTPKPDPTATRRPATPTMIDAPAASAERSALEREYVNAAYLADYSQAEASQLARRLSDSDLRARIDRVRLEGEYISAAYLADYPRADAARDVRRNDNSGDIRARIGRFRRESEYINAAYLADYPREEAARDVRKLSDDRILPKVTRFRLESAYINRQYLAGRSRSEAAARARQMSDDELKRSGG